MFWDAVFWLVAMVFFLIAEASTVTLVSIWFAAGALAAVVVALMGGGTGLQIGVFLAVAVVLLAGLRTVVRKYIQPKIVRTNVDSIIDTVGVVTAQVDNINAQGQVKLGGMEWTARSTSGEILPQGTLVKVDRIEGVKAFVSLAEVSTAK